MNCLPRIPRRIEYTHRALEQVFGYSEPGLYFIVIEDGVFDDAMTHYLNGFFVSIGGRFYSKNTDPFTASPFDPELAELIKDSAFNEEFQEMGLSLAVMPSGDGGATISYSAGGTPVPHVNPRYLQLYRLLSMANDALASENSFFGFLYDGAGFDEPMIDRFNLIFTRLHARLVSKGQMIFFFYNDDKDLSFSKKYLRKSMIFHRIARLVERGSVPLTPFSDCQKNTKTKGQRLLDSSAPLVFFLGAGASMEAGMPSGEEVLDMALMKLLGPKYSNRKEAKEAFLSELGRPPWLDAELVTLEHVISYMARSEGDITELEPVTFLIDRNKKSTARESHRKLVKFCLRKRKAIIITTNFDTILEGLEEVDALFKEEQFNRLATMDRAQILADFSTRHNVGVIKLHGSLKEPASLNVRLEDLEYLPAWKAAVLERIFNPQLQSDEAEKNAIVPAFFVGYGFHDPDLLPLIKDLGMRKVQFIIVSHEPTLAMVELVEQPHSRLTEPQFINLDFESFIEALTSSTS